MQIKEIIKIRKKGDNSSFKYKNALENEKGVLFGGLCPKTRFKLISQLVPLRAQSYTLGNGY